MQMSTTFSLKPKTRADPQSRGIKDLVPKRLWATSILRSEVIFNRVIVEEKKLWRYEGVKTGGVMDSMLLSIDERGE